MQADEAHAPAMRRRVELRRSISRLKSRAFFALALGVVVAAYGMLKDPTGVLFVALGAALFAQGATMLNLGPLLRKLLAELPPAEERDERMAA